MQKSMRPLKDLHSPKKLSSIVWTVRPITRSVPISFSESLKASTLPPSWRSSPLHTALLQSIQTRGFEHPTEIQKRTLEVFFSLDTPEAKRESQNDEGSSGEEKLLEPKRRDIIGISHTVGGRICI